MQAQARQAAAPAFAFAMFLSAALIFALQPMFSRLTTPLLGGSPAVWNTSMAFFQAALLVGYLYAHFLQRLRDLRLQAAVHAAVLLAAFAFLPVQVAFPLDAPPDTTRPILWLLGALTISIGAPFAAASATAPLLQAWYARTGRADAHDPYYLYAASNLGSLLGLLLYPVLVEPLLGAQAQSIAWTFGYAAAVLAIIGCGLIAIAAKGAPPAPVAAGHASWRERLYWLAAAALPSSLMLGVTQHITTDVASAPFLWVIPLALYLITFIIAFLRRSEKLAPAALIAHPLSLAALAMALAFADAWATQLVAYLACFFFSALVCHLALARTRPPAARLTEFYICVSAGGVFGGAATALIAPVVFNGIYEFPLALAAVALFQPRSDALLSKLSTIVAAAALTAALMCIALVWRGAPALALISGGLGAAAALVSAALPSQDLRPRLVRVAYVVCAAAFAGVMIYLSLNPELLDPGAPGGTGYLALAVRVGAAGLGLLMLGLALHAAIAPDPAPQPVANIALGVALPLLFVAFAFVIMRHRFNDPQLLFIAMTIMALAFFMNRSRPILLAGLVLAMFAALYAWDLRGTRYDERILRQERSFFGVLKVEENVFQPSPLRVLMHGTTIHGAQFASGELSRQPLTYYNARTALGQAARAGLERGEKSRLALVGLGTGTSACLTRPQDELTIFEIDPKVVRLSGPRGSHFSYVRQCQPNARIVLGDARLKLAEEPDGSYDVILVDAFSSDAIPAHLLTREAVAMYARKLTPRGVIILHLSNRNLALVAESARVAHALGLPHRWRVSYPGENAIYYEELAASAMVLARTPEALDALGLSAEQWVELAPRPGRPWTDDYINLPRALWENLQSVQ